MAYKTITLEESINSLRGRPGLVYGHLATSFPNSFSLIVESAKNNFDGIDDLDEDNIGLFIDGLRNENPDLARELEAYIVHELDKLASNSDLPWLVSAGWSICISLTQDLLFESALSDYQDSMPSSKTVTLIDHPSLRPDSRTIPIYKLLGNLRNLEENCTLSLAASDQLRRKNMWRPMLSSSTDFLQGSPILFIGTDKDEDLVQELLGNLSSMPPPAPNTLFFLKDDPILSNPVVKSLCGSFANVSIVDANIREFSKALKEMKPYQRALNLATEDQNSAELLEAFKSIVSIVPSASIEEDQLNLHKNELVDSLFKPTTIDWDPYLCNLDLVRDANGELVDTVKTLFEMTGSNGPLTIMVRGEAGVGKTTILKRTAVDLAKEGATTLWCRRAPMGNWIRIYKQLSKRIESHIAENKNSKFVVFVDDPWSLRIDPSELVTCFDNCGSKVVFVFSLRNTEYFNQGGFSYSLPFGINKDIEVSHLLSESELDALSTMLFRIGGAQSVQEGKKLVQTIPSKNTDDVLCSLWYLVPETRGTLAESLKDEYHRLGSVSNTISDFAEAANQVSGESAQHAYEYVAVTSKFHIGLPMEVLVRALKISYEDFIEITVDGKPLWGLIYDEEDIDNRTVLYRTRNEIVTKVLLELVNGGVGHAGEFRALKSLLASCHAGSEIYREFALDVLVRSSKDIEKYFNYQQGLDLFEAAEKAMPHDDRLLAHHKGIWIHRVGRDYKEAYRQFENALELQQYPGTAREAHPEHIHTSMAASVVGLVKSGEQSATQGLQLVKDHIQQASNPRIFSAHSGHISANLLFEMALQQGAFDPSGVGAASYAEALQEVEKTMQSMGPYWKNNTRSEKSIEMLKALQQKIIESIPDDGQLEKYAYESFQDNGSQVGFELFLRKKLSKAQVADKGSGYNSVKEDIDKVLECISKTLEAPSVEIYAIRVDLMIRWRLQKPRGEIDWVLLKDDLNIILDSVKYRGNPIKCFYYAITLFHLGKIEQSNAEFTNLRRMQAIGLSPKNVRFYAAGKEGNPKRYQCNISRRHGRSYAEITELNFDMPVVGSNRDIVNHTYIGFSLNGPCAIYDRPDGTKVLMA